MSTRAIIKVICLTAQALPLAWAAVQGLTLTPEAMAVLVLLNLAAGFTLAELRPGVGDDEDDDPDDLIERVGRQPKAEQRRIASVLAEREEQAAAERAARRSARVAERREQP